MATRNLLGDEARTRAIQEHAAAKEAADRLQQEFMNRMKVIELDNTLTNTEKDNARGEARLQFDMQQSRINTGLARERLDWDKIRDRDPKYKPNLFEMADGRLKEIPVGDEIPVGAKLPKTRTEDLTPGQKLGLEQKMNDYQRWIDQAIESGDSKDLTNVKPYMDFVNKHSETVRYKEEIVPKSWRWGKDTTKYTKEMKPISDVSAPTIQAAPNEAIIYLKNHPETRDAFLEKFGYIPEGM